MLPAAAAAARLRAYYVKALLVALAAAGVASLPAARRGALVKRLQALVRALVVAARFLEGFVAMPARHLTLVDVAVDPHTGAYVALRGAARRR